MTQNTEGRDGDSRYAWAASTTQPTPGQGAAQPYAPYSGASAPTSPVSQAAPPAFPTTTAHPGGGSGAYPYSGSAGQAGQQPGYTGTPPTGGFPAGPGQFPPAPPGGGDNGRRRGRGPGWAGVAGVGILAAVVSSALTVGLVRATDDDTTPTAATTTQTAQTVPGPVTNSNSSSPDWEAVANAVEPSVVAVKVTSQQGSGEGSGVILDKTGQILTNNHVVAGASTVEVDLSDGRGYTAKVVGNDPSTDLAVIKIENPPKDLKAATIGSSGAVTVGDHVMAVGNPLGLAGTVTTGIVSAVDRPVTTQAEQRSSDPFAQQQQQTDEVVTNAIQTDAAVNPGNSGGALVDAQGRVIGINSSIASLGSALSGSQSGSIGLGFAIPIDEARYVASQLADGGTVAHAWLGVGPQDGEVTVGGAKRSAAVLKEIVNNSPASKAGLKTGDAVIGVDGDRVNSATSLVGQIRERRPSAGVTLQVVRDGKQIDVKATLGTSPNN